VPPQLDGGEQKEQGERGTAVVNWCGVGRSVAPKPMIRPSSASRRRVAGYLGAHLLDAPAAGVGGIVDGHWLAGGGQQPDQVQQQLVDRTARG
jgi:hypothetical protein